MSRSVQPAPASELVGALLPWFMAHGRDLPWRQRRDPYAIWISEIMLQQTQVKTVIPYWNRWLERLPDLGALAAAPEALVLKLWEGLGYYSRARNLQRAARLMVAGHDGRFPRTTEDLINLPGIGRYTAGAIASIAFNEPAPILDGNVIRVLTRLFALEGDPKARPLNARLWQFAQELVSAASGISLDAGRFPALAGPCSALNQALMELGATVCVPRSPNCSACPWRAVCLAAKAGRTGEFPQTAARPATVAQRRVVAVLTRQNRFLVIQRTESAPNRGLWEFPSLEITGQTTSPAAAASTWLGLPEQGFVALRPVKHAITRFRIHLDVLLAHVSARPPAIPKSAVWHDLAGLESLAFSGAHRRIVRMLTAIPSADSEPFLPRTRKRNSRAT